MEIKEKVSDLVSSFFQKRIEHIFGLSGGASLHLMHSIEEKTGMHNICCHHEQGCSMAADAYTRVTGRTGVAVATSGPGATNLITGICCSYYDSVPMMAVTGQVSTFRMKGKSKVRQIGFQETPIVDLCKPITKYAVKIEKAKDVLYVKKAYHIANSGKGPVLVDIPDDIQREYIYKKDCAKFQPQKIYKDDTKYCSFIERIEQINHYIKNSEKPIMIAGWGSLANAETFIEKLLDKLQIPIALTWGAADLIAHDNRMYVGTFGTHGQRAANLAVQRADLIISFGARLDTKATGTPIFAPSAKKIVIDIDVEELNKFEEFGLHIDELINDDLSELVNMERTM